ncbi:MAG: hypothetical protein JST01_15260 [Cyanobacteria bacterium SZAS TMP-1]|nr:hypothetical protein [Cyanobacteria bacterium SZAS TMP-1]
MKTAGPIIFCTVVALFAGAMISTAPTAAGDEARPADSARTAGGAAKSTKAAVHKAGAAKKAPDEQAIDLVWRRAEVKQWLAQFPGGKNKMGGHPAVTADPDQDKKNVYSVHVYEDLPDHTATFNWYEVDLKTGKVSKMF